MKFPFFSEKFFRNLLVFLTGLCALSAFGGGANLIVTNGSGMPDEWLSGAFGSFLIPGLILFVIVGGTNLLASVMTWRRSKNTMEYAMTAGFGLQIWLFVQMYIIKQASFLQVVYFVLAIAILICACLLGKYYKK